MRGWGREETFGDGRKGVALGGKGGSAAGWSLVFGKAGGGGEREYGLGKGGDGKVGEGGARVGATMVGDGEGTYEEVPL